MWGEEVGGGGSKWPDLCVRVCALLLQGTGDTNLAHQCFRLALVSNNQHAEAYNNLAVLEMRRGHVEQVSQPRGLHTACLLPRAAAACSRLHT